MKESNYKIQKAPIFSENFNDEATLRKNGGVPTNVTFRNGVASCVTASSSNLSYKNLNLKGIYTVRMRFKSIVPSTNGLIVDFRGTTGTGTGYILFNADFTSLASSTGNIYINGVNTAIIGTTNIKEITAQGITLSSIEMFLSSRYSGSPFVTAEWELCEIYEGTLSASNISNLYLNTRYKSIVNSEVFSPILSVNANNGLISNSVSGNNLSYIIQNETFDNWTGTFPNEIPVGWSAFGTHSANNYVTNSGNRCRIVCTDGTAVGINKFSSLVVGKTYRVSFDLIALSGTLEITGILNKIFTSTTISLGRNSFIGVATATTFTVKRGSTVDCIFDNLVLEEVVPELVNTDVNVVNDGGIYSMKFNGVSSRLDLGNYHPLTGDITIVMWIKKGFGNNLSRYLDNGKLLLRESTPANNVVAMLNDGATASAANLNSGTPNSYQQVIITRTSAGLVSYYINGVLSGSAGQNSGTPVAGTSNIFIGSSGGITNFLLGNIASMMVYPLIFSAGQITRAFSSERKFYNV